MKERENRPEQHEGRKLASSRNLFGCNRGKFWKSCCLKKRRKKYFWIVQKTYDFLKNISLRQFSSVHSSISIIRMRYGGRRWLDECCRKWDTCQPAGCGAGGQSVGYRCVSRRPGPCCAVTSSATGRPAHSQFAAGLHTKEMWACVQNKELATAYWLPMCELKKKKKRPRWHCMLCWRNLQVGNRFDCWKGMREVVIFVFAVCLCRRMGFTWEAGSWEGRVKTCLLKESTGECFSKCQHFGGATFFCSLIPLRVYFCLFFTYVNASFCVSIPAQREKHTMEQ